MRSRRRQAWLAPIYLLLTLVVVFPEAATHLWAVTLARLEQPAAIDLGKTPSGAPKFPPLVLSPGGAAGRAEAEHERQLAKLNPPPAEKPAAAVPEYVVRPAVPLREPAGKKIAESKKAPEDERVIAARMAKAADDKRRADEREAAKKRKAEEAERARIAAADLAAERLIGDLGGTLFTLSFDDSGVAEGFDRLVSSRGGAYFTPRFSMDALEKYQFGKRVLYFSSAELKHPVLLPRDLSRAVLNRIRDASGLHSLASIGEVHVRLRAGGDISGVEVFSLAQLQEVNR